MRRLIPFVIVLTLFCSQALARHELICQDEINPDRYKKCLQQYHETIAQQLLEQEVRQQLRDLKIKIKLPSALTLQETLQQPSNKIYYYVQASSPTHYQVSFDRNPLCHGRERCTIGSLFAAKSEKKLPDNPYLAYAGKSRKTHQRLLLAKKIRGYLEKPSPDHAPFQTLIWNLRGVQYQLTLKKASQQQFHQLADHLIERGY